MDMQNVSNLVIPEGEVRTIHDKDGRLLWGAVGYDTKYAGDTYQQTYSGDNLFDYTDIIEMSSGVSVGDDGWVTIAYDNSGGGTTKYLNYYTNKLPLSTGTNYNILLEIKNHTGNFILYPVSKASNSQFSDNWQVRSSSISDGGIYSTVIMTNPDFDNDIISLRTTLALSPGNSGSVTFRLSLLADTSVTPQTFVYQPYTGGIPAPNPDYPQDVQVVTGEQTVTVTGKNLFDGEFELGIINGTTGLDGANSNYIRSKNYVPVQENTTYFISSPDYTGTWFVYEYDRDKSYNLASNKSTTGAFTTSSGTRYVRFRPNAQIATAPLDIKVQVELGSTATAYTPYQSQSYSVNLGTTELCKLGNYQDYIYKSGDDWYMHKDCGKVIFNGTEDWSLSSNYTNNSRFTCQDIIAKHPSPSPILSNYFAEGVAGTDTQNICVNGSTGKVMVTIANSKATTASELTTWLSTHNTTVYYVLTATTDTKITDNTLIGQLNDVHEWLTRYGYNATVTGNLPIIIGKTNL